ncbi:MAG: prepilin-type N-terminal cleavage/methylation domain-containing protein [Phycisphaerae bacterium]|jgi:prepilin-type N-terminal cleavage/methylation domain-containing protein
MKNKKGFTLIELMVVILIVGILAAVAIPIMRGRIDSAKWSEGKAALGTIATALRAYAAEQGASGTYGANLPTLATLGFSAGDLHGTYFTITNYSVLTSAYNAAGDPQLTFTVKATNTGTGITSPTAVSLTQAGVWTETP